MKIRKFLPETDYAELCSYWKKIGWIAPHLGLLPNDGFVAEENDKLVAAMFIYMSSNSKMSFMSWPISDPDASRLSVGKGLIGIIKEIKEFVADAGNDMIFSVGTTPELEKIFNKMGFISGERNSTTMISIVNYSKELTDFCFNEAEKHIGSN